MLMVLLALAQPAPLTDCGILRFSVSPAMAGASQHIGICHDPERRPGGLLLRRTTTPRGGTPTISYATSRSCREVRERLVALEDLPLPRPDVPGLGAEMRVITVDGAGYRLEGQALYGASTAEISIGSNVGTPLALWIDDTLAALAPCWRDRP